MVSDITQNEKRSVTNLNKKQRWRIWNFVILGIIVAMFLEMYRPEIFPVEIVRIWFPIMIFAVMYGMYLHREAFQ